MPLKIKLSIRTVVLVPLIVFLAGCGGSEPEYVEVESSSEPAPVSQSMVHDPDHDHAAHAGTGKSELGFVYTVPEGWSEMPASSMKLLSLNAGEPPEQVAECSVSAFPGDVGGQLANINRWRRQVGIGPLAPEAADGFVEPVTISGMDGWQVDFTGPESAAGGGKAMRVRVSVIEHAGKSWFFKLMGPAPAVEEELEGYAAFIDSIQF